MKGAWDHSKNQTIKAISLIALMLKYFLDFVTAAWWCQMYYLEDDDFPKVMWKSELCEGIVRQQRNSAFCCISLCVYVHGSEVTSASLQRVLYFFSCNQTCLAHKNNSCDKEHHHSKPESVKFQMWAFMTSGGSSQWMSGTSWGEEGREEGSSMCNNFLMPSMTLSRRCCL